MCTTPFSSTFGPPNGGAGLQDLSGNIPYSRKIWRALNLPNPFSEHIGGFFTDRIRITLYCCSWRVLNLAISANSPIRQIKNLAKTSRCTVAVCLMCVYVQSTYSLASQPLRGLQDLGCNTAVHLMCMHIHRSLAGQPLC